MLKLKELREATAHNLRRAFLPMQRSDVVKQGNVTWTWSDFNEPRAIVRDGILSLVMDFDPRYSELNTGHVVNTETDDVLQVDQARLDSMASYMLSIIEDPTIR